MYLHFSLACHLMQIQPLVFVQEIKIKLANTIIKPKADSHVIYCYLSFGHHFNKDSESQSVKYFNLYLHVNLPPKKTIAVYIDIE